MNVQPLRDAVISEPSRKLLDAPNLAHLATTDADGSPHVTPVWVDVEGDDIVLNTAEGRKKLRNLRKNPQCSISLVDPQNPYNVFAVKGRVVQITEEGADEHIDRLAKKYLGVDTYPLRKPDEKRIKVRIRADEVLMEPSEAA